MAPPARIDLPRAGRRLLQGLPRLWPTLLLLCVVLGILVPLPTLLVDLLLSISLAGSVLVLVGTLTIRRAAHFLGFPTLLMLITLYRLAINLSTTRLILTQADAGRVVDAFGDLVIRGDLVVGGVMFLILTVVQYLVIARGAERVAEVAARFALDGMPGHQAAIDADLRAGTITAAEAGRRRAELGERSNFYGNMDGAVRYVKADAIASLAITAINLCGGLAIGLVRHSMTLADAFDVYGRLTIGDGLLAQIPALLVSLAAGLLVSKVDRERDDVGARWLEPQMFLVPAVLLGVLAAIPGMPVLAFAATAVGLVALALLLAARQPALVTAGDGPRLVVRLSPADAGRLRNDAGMLEGLRQRCSDALGVDLPRVVVRRDGQREGQVEVRLGERLLSSVPIAGATEEAIVVGAFRGIMGRASALIDLEEVEARLERARLERPALVREALRVMGAPDLLWLLRALLNERLPAPSMPDLLEVVAANPAFKDPAQRRTWPALVRERLAVAWLPELLAAVEGLGPARWLRPTPDLEDRIVRAASFDGEWETSSLPEKERERLRMALGAGEGPLVVLTTPYARAATAAVLFGASPHVPVVSTAELRAAGIEVGPALSRATWVDVD
jgi:type III secretion protein V